MSLRQKAIITSVVILLIGSIAIWASAAEVGGYQIAPEGCRASNPGMPECAYTATANGAIAGYAVDVYGWTVTINRPGTDPIIVRSGGGSDNYQCGIIRPGDSVTATTEPNAWVTVGNPGICF